MRSLERRIRALEKRSSGKGLNVFIRNFASLLPDGSFNRISLGEEFVEREPGEADDAFRDRAVSKLRRGQVGVLALEEGGPPVPDQDIRRVGLSATPPKA